MAFPIDALDVTVEAFYDSAWNDITSDALDRDGKNSIVIRPGRTSSTTRCAPGHASLKLNNATGKYSPRNPNSPLFGKIGRNTPLRISYTVGAVTYIRFVGEVAAWPSRWDPSGSDVWVQVEAWGILRRLGQGSSPLKSALRRAVLSSSPAPIAYWSLEDGVRASTAASGLVGGNPMVGSIIFQSNEGPDGSDSVVSIRSGGTAWGQVVGCGTTSWTVEHVALWPDTDSPAVASMSLEIEATGGTVSSWRIWADNSPDVVQVAYLVPPALVYTALSTTEPGYNGEWKHLRLEATQDGADIDVVVTINGSQVLSTTIAGQTIGAITRVGLATFEDVPDGEIPAVGHITVWSGAAVTVDTPAAAHGYPGELVTDRLTRLCDEEDVSLAITGESSAKMGPQRIATLLELLEDCAAVDRGFLHEQREAVGLAYRTNSSRFGQAARLTLDYSAQQVHPPFEPLPDDQGIVNDVEVRQRDGTFAHVQEDTGPLSVQSPPDGVGRYDTSLTVDAYSADQLPQIASWIKTLGTQDVERYPSVHVNLRANSGLLAAAATAQLQDRLVITNLPSWMPPDDPDLIIEGYAETISQFSLDLTFNCSPGNLYQNVGRWGLLAHELRASINSAVTSIDIATTDVDQPMLATSGLGSGYGVTIGGEDLQVTAVAASTITAFAGSTSAHADNASVTPALSGSLAAGNLILVLAAIRNSGTGTVNTPAGYTRLAVFPSSGNVQVFAKIAGASETDPTISFTGGAAGASCSAQTTRLAGKWRDVDNILVGAAWRLNASAQDIIVPGLPKPVCDNAIVIGVAWKQDDWTSVATRSGFTEIGEPDTTLGDDQGIVWDQVVQTTATSVPATPFVVTGGASASSRSAIFALRCDYQTATVTRGINGTSAASHAAGDAVTMTRPMRWALI